MYFPEDIQSRLCNLEQEIHNLIALEQSINNRTVSSSTPQLCSYHLATINDIAEKYSSFCQSIHKSDVENNIHEPPQRDVSTIRTKKKLARCHRIKKEPRRPLSVPTTMGCLECSRPELCSRHSSRSRSNSPMQFQEDVCQQISNIVECMRKSSDYAEKNSNVTHRRDPCPSPKNISRTSSCPVKCSRGTSFVSLQSQNAIQDSPCEGDVRQLKVEVEKIKEKICDITNCKKKALEVTTELKGRYDKLLLERNELKKQLKELQKENKCLCDNLINTIQLQEESNEQVRDAKVILSTYKDQASRFQEQTSKFTSTLNETKEKFCKCVKEKEKCIADLKNENEHVRSKLKDKTKSYECLCGDVSKLKEEVCMCNEKIKNISESNSKLSSSLETMDSQLKNTQTECSNYKMEIDNSKKQIETLNLELEKKCKCEEQLREEKKILEDKISHGSEEETKLLENVNQLSFKLREQCQCTEDMKNEKLGMEKKLRERENNNIHLKEQICQLNCKIDNLENVMMDLGPNHNEMNRLKEDNEQLREKYIEVAKKVKMYECRESSRRNSMMDCQCKGSTDKEKVLKKENDELRNLVEELTCVVKHNKVALLNMASTNKQQQIMLESQTNALQGKADELKNASCQIGCLINKCADLEKQICCLKQTVGKFECLDNKFQSLENSVENMSIQELINDLENIKNELEEERSKVQIQKKITEDNQKTICQLKRKLDDKDIDVNRHRQEAMISCKEMRRMSDELSKTLCLLKEEQREKESLYCQLNDLQDQRGNLAHKVDQLERLVNEYCENNRGSSVSYEQERALVYMEQQLHEERVESQRLNDILVAEKEKAVHAARFATQKLLETVSDFQKQTVVHKQVHKMLTGLLREKEEKLAAVTNKMKNFAILMKKAKTLQENISNEVKHNILDTRNTCDMINTISVEDFQDYVDCVGTEDENSSSEPFQKLCICR